MSNAVILCTTVSETTLPMSFEQSLALHIDGSVRLGFNYGLENSNKSERPRRHDY